MICTETIKRRELSSSSLWVPENLRLLSNAENSSLAEEIRLKLLDYRTRYGKHTGRKIEQHGTEEHGALEGETWVLYTRPRYWMNTTPSGPCGFTLSPTPNHICWYYIIHIPFPNVYLESCKTFYWRYEDLAFSAYRRPLSSTYDILMRRNHHPALQSFVSRLCRIILVSLNLSIVGSTSWVKCTWSQSNGACHPSVWFHQTSSTA